MQAYVGHVQVTCTVGHVQVTCRSYASHMQVMCKSHASQSTIPFSLCAAILHCTITSTQAGRVGSVSARAVRESSVKASLDGQEGENESQSYVQKSRACKHLLYYTHSWVHCPQVQYGHIVLVQCFKLSI